MRVYELFLGYACDERCFFCSQETAWRRLPSIDLRGAASRIYQAYNDGCRVLAVNGGEPTLHRDLPKMVAFARRAGFPEIHLQSNGVRLADPDYARELARAGLTLVRLSLHGHTDELHDRQVRQPGALARARRALANLRALGVPAGVNVVVNRMNVSELGRILAHFHDEEGVRDFGVIFPLYEGDMAANLAETRVSLTEAADAVRAAFPEFRARRAEPPFLLNFTPCVLPGYEDRVLRWSRESAAVYDGAGRIVIDPEDYAIDHRGEGSRGLGEEGSSRKAKPAACARCVHDGACLGYERRYLELFGEDEFRPLAEVSEPFDAGWGPWTSSWRRMVKAGAAR